RHREGRAGEPGTMEPALLPLRVGNRACLLVLEPDPGGEPETEAPRVLGDQVDAEALSGLVEEHVARLDDGLVEAHVTVPAMAPAAEEVVAERNATAAAAARAGGGGGAPPPPRPPTHHCEGGAGRIRPPPPRVAAGLQRPRDPPPPLGVPDAAGEEVRIVRRPRGQHEHVAVARIE